MRRYRRFVGDTGYLGVVGAEVVCWLQQEEGIFLCEWIEDAIIISRSI